MIPHTEPSFFVTGSRLISAANSILKVGKEGNVACLCAVANLVQSYARHGYTNLAWDVVLYEGEVKPDKLQVSDSQPLQIVSGTTVPIDKILEYDESLQPGVVRKLFWEENMKGCGVVFLVAFDGEKVV